MNHIELGHPWALVLAAAMLPAAWFIWRTYDPMRRARKIAVLAARLLVIALVVVGLASVRWVHPTPHERLCVLAVLDVSRSVSDASLADAMPRLDELFARAEPKRSVGLIVFGGDARVAIPPRSEAPAEDVRKAVEAARLPQGGVNVEATNVERAIDLAMATFAPGAGRRIVLLSDGNANDGQAQAKLARCRDGGIEVCVVPLSQEHAPFDLAVTGVSVPTDIQSGAGFDVTVRTAARAEAAATLALYRSGYLLEERKVVLPAGRHDEVFRQRLDEPGLYLYRARLTTDRKQSSLDNDAAYAFTRLRTSLKILVLGEAETEAARLLSAIREGGMACEFRGADAAPERLSDLLDFDAVVLNNLRASSLDGPRQRMLRDYVELFGGAMLVVGLDSSGGYDGTPIEEALPVVCGLSRLGNVSSSVVVIADTSRSLVLADADERHATMGPMTEAASISRPEIIRRTAKQIVAGLGERDTFGLIGFGSEMYSPRWVVRPQKVYDRKKIEWNIDNHLLTAPRFDDPQALADLVARMAKPTETVPPDQLARDIEAIADPQHLPHLTAKTLMPYLRNKLKISNQAVNPDELAGAVEKLMEPNAFLARSNAARSVQRAVGELKARQSASKRIIMLTDGYLEGGDKNSAAPGPGKASAPPKDNPAAAAKPSGGGDVDYERLAGQLAADGITISTIALKYDDANQRLLTGVARWGLGREYSLADPAAFVEQFRKEIESIGKPRVMEFPLRAEKAADSSLVRGVDVPVAPQLFGYVRTAPKLGARNVLVVPPDYEPLLATWDFGAGRTAVFTSDAQPRWASLWIRDWPQGYNRLWGSVLQSLCERPPDRRLLPQLNVKGPEIDLAVDFLDEANRFLNGQSVKARFYFLGEDGYVFSRASADEVTLTQECPARCLSLPCAPKRPVHGSHRRQRPARGGGDGVRRVAPGGGHDPDGRRGGAFPLGRRRRRRSRPVARAMARPGDGPHPRHRYQPVGHDCRRDLLLRRRGPSPLAGGRIAPGPEANRMRTRPIVGAAPCGRPAVVVGATGGRPVLTCCRAERQGDHRLPLRSHGHVKGRAATWGRPAVVVGATGGRPVLTCCRAERQGDRRLPLRSHGHVKGRAATWGRPYGLAAVALVAGFFATAPAVAEDAAAEFQKVSLQQIMGANWPQFERTLAALTADPRNDQAFQELSVVLADAGALNKVAPYLELALKQRPDDLTMRIILGRVSKDLLRDSACAKLHFEAVLKADADNFYAHYQLGALLARADEREFPQALAHYRSAVEKVPRQYADLRTRILREMGDLLYTRRGANPQYEAEALAAWDAVTGGSRKFDLQTYEELAGEYRSRQLWKKEQETYERYFAVLKEINDSPDNVTRCRLKTCIAEACRQQAEYAGAVEALTEAASLLDENAPQRRGLESQIRQCRLKLGQGPPHEQELRRAVEAAPQSVAARQSLARVLVGDGRLDDAAAALESARALAPRNVPVLSALEAIYRKSGRDDKLADILRARIALSAEDYGACLDLADLYVRTGKMPEAQKVLADLEASPSQLPEKYLLLARACVRYALPKRAFLLYKKVMDSGGADGNDRLEFCDFCLAHEGFADEATAQATALSDGAALDAAGYVRLAEVFRKHDKNEAVLGILARGLARAGKRPDGREDRQAIFTLNLAMSDLEHRMGAGHHSQAIGSTLRALLAAPDLHFKLTLNDRLATLLTNYGHRSKLLYSPEEELSEARFLGGARGEGIAPWVDFLSTQANSREDADLWMLLGQVHEAVEVDAELAAAVPSTAGRPHGAAPTEAPATAAAPATRRIKTSLAQARLCYQKVVDMEFQNVDGHLAMARVLADPAIDEYERAVNELEVVSLLNPVTRWESCQAIGDLYAAAGENALAGQRWQAVADQSAGEPNLLNQVAMRMFRGGELKSAIDLAECARDINPSVLAYRLSAANLLGRWSASEATPESLTKYVDELAEALALAQKSPAQADLAGVILAELRCARLALGAAMLRRRGHAGRADAARARRRDAQVGDPRRDAQRPRAGGTPVGPLHGGRRRPRRGHGPLRGHPQGSPADDVLAVGRLVGIGRGVPGDEANGPDERAPPAPTSGPVASLIADINLDDSVRAVLASPPSTLHLEGQRRRYAVDARAGKPTATSERAEPLAPGPAALLAAGEDRALCVVAGDVAMLRLDSGQVLWQRPASDLARWGACSP